MSNRKGESSFDTDWDVDQYRHEWDSDEQWEVRSEFILAHKDTIPEDQLICLAQVYANIEFLSCSYNEDVMKQVESLAEGLSTIHRERKKLKEELKFVKESNPSGSAKRPNESWNPQQSKYQRFGNNNNPNRSSAASYFGSNSNESSVPSQNANNYRTQSYYTKDYKSNQEGRNWGSGAEGGSGTTTSSLSQGGRQQKYWTSGNDQLLTLTKTFQSIASMIESDTFDPLTSFNHLVTFARNKGLEVRVERDYKKNMNLLRLYIGNVLAIENQARSKKRIVSDTVCKLYELFATKSWKLVLNDFQVIELVVIGEKGIDPIPSEPSFDPYGTTESGGVVDSTSMKLKSVLHDFVLVDRIREKGNKTSVTKLHDSANFTRKKLVFVKNVIVESGTQVHRFVVQLEGIVVGEGRGTISQKAKEAAALAALNKLRPLVYTLQIKEPVVSEVVSRGSVMTNGGVQSRLEKAIDEDNVGNKLLRMMGWKGGGLGREDNKGIIEPVKVNPVYGRKGLGLSDKMGITGEFICKVTKVIREYALSDSKDNLTFSSEFGHEERVHMHRIADKFHLKSVSKGVGADRFLIIKRRQSPEQLIELVRQSGGAIENYKLLPPHEG